MHFIDFCVLRVFVAFVFFFFFRVLRVLFRLRFLFQFSLRWIDSSSM